MRGQKNFYLCLSILFLTIYGVESKEGHEGGDESPETITSILPTSSQINEVVATNTPENSSCNDTMVLSLMKSHTWNNLEQHLEQCPQTKNISFIGQFGLPNPSTVYVDIDNFQKVDNLELNLNYFDEVNLSYYKDGCPTNLKIKVNNVHKIHMNQKLYKQNCINYGEKDLVLFITFDKIEETVEPSPKPCFQAVNNFNENVMQTPSKETTASEKNVVTALSVIIAVMSIIIVALLFYAFCFKQPVTGGKQEPKRSVTIEDATEISARRPTILSDTHKAIAEAARDASVNKKILRNNSMKKVEKKTDVVELEGEQKETKVNEEKAKKIDESETTGPTVMETTVQVHAESPPETLDCTPMPPLMEQSPEIDSEDPKFDETKTTSDVKEEVKDPKTPEEVKINVEVSEDEACKKETTTDVADEPKRSSKIPVPVRSDSADSAKSKGSNKSRKSESIDVR